MEIFQFAVERCLHCSILRLTVSIQSFCASATQSALIQCFRYLKRNLSFSSAQCLRRAEALSTPALDNADTSSPAFFTGTLREITDGLSFNIADSPSSSGRTFPSRRKRAKYRNDSSGANCPDDFAPGPCNALNISILTGGNSQL